MDNRKTSQGFAKFSIKTLVYVVMIVVAIVCATTAYSFGSQIFSNEGVDPKPGTDMTFTVDEGTSIEIFGKTLEQLVDDGISGKVTKINDDSQEKLQNAMEKIVNESSGGLICIII